LKMRVNGGTVKVKAQKEIGKFKRKNFRKSQCYVGGGGGKKKLPTQGGRERGPSSRKKKKEKRLTW